MPSTARAHECAICRRSFLAGETVRLYRDHPSRAAVKVCELCPATAEEWPVVERLAQLERHDLSQFPGYVPRADGTYAFDRLDLFRAEPGRQAEMAPATSPSVISRMRAPATPSLKSGCVNMSIVSPT